MGVEEAAIVIHRQVVVDDHVGPLPIKIEPDSVHSSVNIKLDEHLLDCLRVVAGNGPHGPKEEARADVALHNVSRLDPTLEQHGPLLLLGASSAREATEEGAQRRSRRGRNVDNVCQAPPAGRLPDCAIPPWCLLVHVEDLLGSSLGVPLRIHELLAGLFKPLDNLVDFRGAPLVDRCLARGGCHERRRSHEGLHTLREPPIPPAVALCSLPFHLGQDHLALFDKLPALLRRSLHLVERAHHFVEQRPNCRLVGVVVGPGGHSA
mmetsp:Transcript_72086/g.167051  ORF Transcript_72086/g.167051 Transcript_72086/m.167051 type:complete len:264 (+) Transcript_72086:1246-2037(+)